MSHVTGLHKVISGGQTGVDQAALRAARDSGLEIGGWCPPGRGCEAGVIPPEFRLQETPNDRSPEAPDVPRSQRTEWNVRDSEGTLVIVENEGRDPGTEWTVHCAKRYQRPLLICEVDDSDAKGKVRQWMAAHPITTLNVAGPSESTVPGISEHSYVLLKSVFSPS